MKKIKWLLYIVAALFLLPVVLISCFLIYWDVRTPPSFEPDAVLNAETWSVTPSLDDIRTQHNSNTELIFFDGYFYLIHAQTKWHLQDINGALVVKRSRDAREWEEVARITVPETDVRDPKLALINGRLFLYFLPNDHFDPMPVTTYWTVSDDGITWETPREMDTMTVIYRSSDGTERYVTGGVWNMWRPKTYDGETWYVVASGKKPEFGARMEVTGHIEGDSVKEEGMMPLSVLFSSTDGIHWEEVSEVYSVFESFEATLEFLPDATAVSTLRVSSMGTAGYAFGNPTSCTLIATAKPPYEEWSYAPSFITRLDGATLFTIGDRMFAAGRNHMGPRFDMGNHMATKRTALFEVKGDRLVHLFDLPSNGDTAYTGVVVRGDDIFISYYTCPIDKDYPWVVGVCFLPKTEVRMARISASGLVTYADRIIAGDR